MVSGVTDDTGNHDRDVKLAFQSVVGERAALCRFPSAWCGQAGRFQGCDKELHLLVSGFRVKFHGILTFELAAQITIFSGATVPDPLPLRGRMPFGPFKCEPIARQLPFNSLLQDPLPFGTTFLPLLVEFDGS